MTYTKKKIAVEVEVPDGATHYEFEEGIVWYRLNKSVCAWWDGADSTWRLFLGLEDYYATDNVQPIEVIK